MVNGYSYILSARRSSSLGIFRSMALAGSSGIATLFALGNSVRNSSKRLPVSATDPELMPARLRPEPAKLLTNACGLPELRNSTGIPLPSAALAEAAVATSDAML